MKITKQLLKMLIKESIEEVLQGGKATLPSSVGNMSLKDLVEDTPEALLNALKQIALSNPELANTIATAVRTTPGKATKPAVPSN